MSLRPKRVVFAGTPAFAATLLSALLEAEVPLVGVLSQPDRPAGRGRKLTASPVKSLALEAGLAVATPPSLRKPEHRETLEAWAPDLMIVAAYGLILPPTVLSLPRHGCLNVHASLLPRWRGAAPVERALMAGDKATGVCIMQMDEGLDTGPVRYRLTVPIEDTTTGGALEASLATLGAKALLTVLSDLSLPAHAPEPQSSAGVTYADKLSAEDRVLNFAESALAIARKINALSPRLACSIESEDSLRIRCLCAAAAPETPVAGAKPGTVLCCNKEGLFLATGSGALRLHQLQVLKGKAAVLDAPAFFNGYGRHLPVGSRFASAQ